MPIIEHEGSTDVLRAEQKKAQGNVWCGNNEMFYSKEQLRRNCKSKNLQRINQLQKQTFLPTLAMKIVVLFSLRIETKL